MDAYPSRVLDVDHRIGDKVAIKGPGQATRGVIEERLPAAARVRTREGSVVEVAYATMTNYSAAARKAWSKQPLRRVGRPRGATVDRVTVNVRLDRELWNAFKDAETEGLITARSETINAWLRDGLTKLRRIDRR